MSVYNDGGNFSREIMDIVAQALEEHVGNDWHKARKAAKDALEALDRNGYLDGRDSDD
jgi:hypothetical protein